MWQQAICFSALFASTSLLAVNASAVPRYRVTDLGSLGTEGSYASAINNKGQIVGASVIVPTGEWDCHAPHAFVWDSGRMIDLGSLESYSWTTGARTHVEPLYDTWSAACDLNDRGQIVGYAVDADSQIHAVVWADNGVLEQDLGGGSVGSGINDSGEIAGYTYPVRLGQATMWRTGTPTSLGRAGEWESFSTAISSSGATVGYRHTLDEQIQGFLWQDGAFTDLGYLTDVKDCQPISINDAGWVVGESGRHAFLFKGGSMQDIGRVGKQSAATSINNNGQIIGYYNEGSSPAAVPVLWENGVMYELNDLIELGAHYSLEYASDINDAGWIVGSAYADDGFQHAVLLTPVPEPVTALMLLAGVSSLPLGRRTR